MKTMKILAALAAAMTMLAACTADEQLQDNNTAVGEPIEFMMQLPTDLSTRTTLTDDNTSDSYWNIHWANGDTVRVYKTVGTSSVYGDYVYNNGTWTYDSGTLLEWGDNEECSFTAVYPAGCVQSLESAGTVKINIPFEKIDETGFYYYETTQGTNENITIEPYMRGMIMLATATVNSKPTDRKLSLEFKPACTVLDVTFTNSTSSNIYVYETYFKFPQNTDLTKPYTLSMSNSAAKLSNNATTTSDQYLYYHVLPSVASMQSGKTLNFKYMLPLTTDVTLSGNHEVGFSTSSTYYTYYEFKSTSGTLSAGKVIPVKVNITTSK